MSSKILFVEDEKDFSDLIVRCREYVDVVYCGEMQLIVLQSLGMAKHVIATNGVSLIILDLTMPDSPQKDTIEWIISEHNHLPPIYAVTGDEKLATRNACIDAGVYGFVLKKHIIESPNFFFSNLYNTHRKYLRDHGAE